MCDALKGLFGDREGPATFLQEDEVSRCPGRVESLHLPEGMGTEGTEKEPSSILTELGESSRGRSFLLSCAAVLWTSLGMWK